MDCHVTANLVLDDTLLSLVYRSSFSIRLIGYADL